MYKKLEKMFFGRTEFWNWSTHMRVNSASLATKFGNYLPYLKNYEIYGNKVNYKSNRVLDLVWNYVLRIKITYLKPWNVSFLISDYWFKYALIACKRCHDKADRCTFTNNITPKNKIQFILLLKPCSICPPSVAVHVRAADGRQIERNNCMIAQVSLKVIYSLK